MKHDFYIDDYIGGANTVEEAIKLRTELMELIGAGGFKLRKWCSNRPEALEGIPSDDLGSELSLNLELQSGQQIKTLGITWEPSAGAASTA